MAKKEKIVDQYAQAILSFAEEENQTAAIKDDLLVLVQVLAEQPKLTALLQAQTISMADQEDLLDKLAGQATAGVLNLLKVLLAHHHFDFFPAVVERFVALDQARRGIVPVLIKTATAIDDDQKQRLTAAFQKKAGAKEVLADFEVDPALIGGVVMRSDALLIDGSLQNKIAQIKAELLG
ncbi:ATP synthase F1 subunit delta [Leuconostocaceae bacterium ESL0958]|nr:ATP synthase F1 subunit delta [Leuconostocaceae bacterium ESL0958]